MIDVVLMSRIERLVVGAVLGVLREEYPKRRFKLECKDLYIGKGNLPLDRNCARQFTFRVMHDYYALPYSAIAERSGMRRDSVIATVRKVRDMRFTDKLYKKIDLAVWERFERE